MKKILICFILVVIFSNTVLAMPTDKTAHLAAGITIYSLSEILDMDKPINYVFLFAASKEIYDLYNTGSVEVNDMSYTLLGGYIVKFKF